MPAGTAAPPVASPRVLVSIATYNEKDNLTPLVAAIHQHLPAADVLVVDDNSPDGTGRLADELSAKDSRVHVVHRAGKLGLGTAILAAMRHAIEYGYDYHVNMDADFSHPPAVLPALVGGMDRYDVMIGSRYVAGGGTENWPFVRRAISRSVNGLVRVLLWMPVRDASGAYRCYRVSLLKKADLEKVRSRGYSFQQEVLFRCYKAGARLGETPIVFANRRAGASKVNWKESVRSLSMIWYLGLRNWVGLERRSR
jgi:dolichol-phosphate mannosyltransferase